MTTFFDLPAELRNNVYELLVKGSSEVYNGLRFTHGGLKKQPEFKQYMVLGRVCHRFRSEATSYFYGENNFWFYLNPRSQLPFAFEVHDSTNGKGFVAQWCRAVSIDAVSSLRYMTVATWFQERAHDRSVYFTVHLKERIVIDDALLGGLEFIEPCRLYLRDWVEGVAETGLTKAHLKRLVGPRHRVGNRRPRNK